MAPWLPRFGTRTINRLHDGIYALARQWVLAVIVACLGAPVMAGEGTDTPKPAPARSPAPAFFVPKVKLDATALAGRIDEMIDQRLKAEGVAAAAPADDAEFLRRVYLDVVGVVPPADKVAAFLDRKEPAKRAQLIDELLGDPRFGRHLADVWQGLLLPKNSDNRRLQTGPLHAWLEKAFNEGRPWDGLVSDLLTASGTQEENGAVTFFLANPTADKMTDEVTRVFLGVQLQCAQCHNHPFTGWKQDDYWAMAAFFTRVKTDNVKKAAKQGGPLSVSEGGRLGRQQKLPTSAKVVPARFLLGEQPKMAANAAHRPVLARWLTAADNPFFARAFANRVWALLLGQGIVSPIDDMTDANPPSHPELLQELAGQFAANGFDVRYLYRAVCNSRAYQRTSRGAGDDEGGPRLFARMALKVLTPEQLYDALSAVAGEPGKQGPRGRRQQQKLQGKGPAGANARAAFVAFFGSDEGGDSTEYQAGIPQALRLMNGPQFTGGKLLEQAAKEKTPARVIEHLYLGSLARRPSPDEMKRLTAYVQAHQAEGNKAYADVLWAVLNSSEFAVNH